MARPTGWQRAKLHLTLLVLLPAFLVAADWQLHRAVSGNELSWAYVVEWPLFAIYAVVVWWRLLQDDDVRRRLPRWRSAPRTIAKAEARDLEQERDRQAYNAYLAALAADEARRSERRQA